MSYKDFFSPQDMQRIKEAIVAAESHTSGEIRVHLEKNCKADTLKRAEEIFAKLKMNQTKDRNGVLIYLAVEDKVFAVYGDAGLNARLPENFWDGIKDKMLIRFKAGEFTEGLCEAITSAGMQLKTHFPAETVNPNELSDDISTSE
jgi:uncharacterized membrane protein